MWAVAAQPRTGLTPMIPTPSVDSGIARANAVRPHESPRASPALKGESVHAGSPGFIGVAITVSVSLAADRTFGVESYSRIGGECGIRTRGGGFADLCLTTWLTRHRPSQSHSLKGAQRFSGSAISLFVTNLTRPRSALGT